MATIMTAGFRKGMTAGIITDPRHGRRHGHRHDHRERFMSRRGREADLGWA